MLWWASPVFGAETVTARSADAAGEPVVPIVAVVPVAAVVPVVPPPPPLPEEGVLSVTTGGAARAGRVPDDGEGSWVGNGEGPAEPGTLAPGPREPVEPGRVAAGA